MGTRVNTAVGVPVDEDTVHGRHVPRAQPDAQQVEWIKHRPTASTFRFVAGTCPCKARVYELYAAAGLRHIRRVDQDPDRGDTTMYTPPDPTAKVDALWDRILTGEAR